MDVSQAEPVSVPDLFQGGPLPSDLGRDLVHQVDVRGRSGGEAPDQGRDGPGDVDLDAVADAPAQEVEDLSDLGNNLKLPPWEERFRGEIESGLASVVVGAR